ncbi:geranylgeranyl diphosphate synthase, type I [Actinomadura madurae]|uniref:Geranylgeranyl diphosphate synthase, type I n=1 Tax=Actinomadura madurae TaxID=1993 RepID=A0A1I5RIQ6_9ACTN|nr:polyprenyl synthetase family protein [Actinomadura madurae]SFP58408.1 geranylgeranyl diphosphate synthase, type I [Actinomadura madurae]
MLEEPFASTLSGLRLRTAEVINNFVLERGARIHDMVGDGDAGSLWPKVIANLEDFLQGGKRLRAAFCHWGWCGAGGAPEDDGIVRAGAALELLHAFALIHDDIMDGSQIRRGSPTMHRSYVDLHASSGCRGSSDEFGVAVAILLGDLCLGWFHELLDEATESRSRAAFARRLMAEMFTELFAGQYLDVLAQAGWSCSVHEARRIVLYKTTKYTVERPLHLGGILAGAGPALLRGYSAYALPLGEAFQLRDDLLGAFGDPALTGKPAADDLRLGKATVLLCLAQERASAAQAKELQDLLRCPNVDDAGIQGLRRLLTETGAVAATEERIGELTRTAKQRLNDIPLTPSVHDALLSLASYASHRDR